MPKPNRKDSILDAALACITEVGADATTIEMIRERSGASIGSLYHHFGNKERILASLYFEGLRRYAERLDVNLAAAAQATECISALVTSYIDWVVENPDWARFILHSRGRIEAGEMGEQLKTINREHYVRLQTRLQTYREQGCFRDLPPECFASIIIGPAHDMARNWLAGRLSKNLVEYREMLAETAWLAVRATPDQPPQ
ncbi:TetR/AcrR family transcriptional regulator [Halopseudomonas sabulinigri]|uniref:TetR/AcrR family transcriptional regulator n=1 Tax=Halopseudomonas sabulinigri TaxID=472181 RepID=A0ABP9ZK57_9GAMM